MTRPTLLSRIRNPKPAQLVEVTLTGDPKAVADLARAIAKIALVTAMTHHVKADGDLAGVRIEATCYRPGAATTAGGRS